ncbi:MAG: carbohydrate ABC transporter permease [Candidatus Pristimantibacillus lignocellulolyticus]|uniref:Carbohydrate ABC transporter permease n=1 Tax=Candidatus Pristimantibacillus lignocellulolyticus TaxID=2994561 RepID=A0A9J6ZGY7_9BACL|nr:MAG: carbohydrate ABC transporter permease [Candidatus Pristimantibacillus lignocellulolyticus]
MQPSISAKTISYVFVFVLLCIYLVPILLVFNVSLKSFEDYLNNPFSIASQFNFSNYTEAWKQGNFSDYLLNSLLYTGVTTVVSIILAIFAAFPIARGYIAWGGFFYLLFVMSQFLPNPVVAQYRLMLFLRDNVHSDIGYNSKIGYMLLRTSGAGLVFMMFVGYIKSISRELDEAAGIDGAGYLRFLFQIIMPLIKPIIATGVILTVIGTWNDLVGPIQFLSSPEHFPITAGLKEFRGQYGNNWPLLACAVMIVAAPLVILFLFIQKYIVNGALAGAIKS